MNPEVQAKVDAIKQKYNYVPPAAQKTAASDWFTATAPKEAPPTFSSEISKIGDIWGKRADEVNAIQNSDQNTFSKQLQTLGKGAQVLGDTAGELISSAIKPEVKQAIGEKIGPLIEQAKNSETGQKVINWWADLESAHPELAKNLEATGQIGVLLSNAIGAGGVKAGTEVGLNIAKDAIAPTVDTAKGAVQTVKDTIAGAKNSVEGLGTGSFKDVYNAHAQNTKALGNTLEKTTIVKDGKTITPIDTMEAYTATPKIVNRSSGGHALDFTDIKAEAEANSKAANKAVDAQIKDMQQLKPFAFSKKEVMASALDAASKDKEIVRTASLPGVQNHIKQIFEDYGIKGDTMTPEQINEFRKGANQASQAYYNTQAVAATAGTIPKDVADRAQAFAVLGDVFREKLVKFDPTLDTLLTTQRLHNAVQQYASRAHLSSVGVSGGTRTGIDAAAAGAGAMIGTMIPVPGASIAGAAAGVTLSEKAQAMLLKRTYEGAAKNGGSLEGKAALKQTPDMPTTESKSLESTIPSSEKKTMADIPLGLSTKSVIPDPMKVAQDLTPKDIKIIRNYIDLDQGKVPVGGNADFTASTEFDTFLQNEGINPTLFTTEKAKAQYASELLDHYEAALNEANIQPRKPDGKFDKKPTKK